MNEKDLQIIEVGMKLFASKGFSATSIQEIATESGISKGAFYLHFKSKDDLLLAILHYHFDRIQNAFHKQSSSMQHPREKLCCELMALFSHFIAHRELLVMLSKEQAIPRNETIKQLLLEKQMEAHQRYRDYIIKIYGEEIEKYSWDLTMILEGIITSYMGIILFSHQNFELKRLTEFILNRLDSLARDIHQDQPFLTKEKVDVILSNLLCSDHPTLATVLKNLEEEIEKLGEEELTVTLQVLIEEISKEAPRIPVIQGMLSNFNGYPTLATYQAYIVDYFASK